MSDMSDTINVLLVDDQALLRQALANLLSQNTDLNIVGTASDGHEAIKQVALNRPDVVLLDIEMPNLDGLSATQLIAQRFPETKVILLSAHDDNAYLMNALKVGAKAYLLKSTLGEEITDTIRNVHKGYGQFGPGILEKMVAGIATPTKSISEVESSVSLETILTTTIHRFEPDELVALWDQLHDRPEAAIALRPNLEACLQDNPHNLAALYLLGALARQSGDQPQVAVDMLARGYEAGVKQTLPAKDLLLFYQAAAEIDPTTAFGWLTQQNNPWSSPKHLPFLIQEAATRLGKTSSQYRLLLVLYRVQLLKALLPTPREIYPPFPAATILDQTPVTTSAT